MHKRGLRLSISTMTGFPCPRVLSRTGQGDATCNGKINSTHHIVRRKPYKGIGSTAAPPARPTPKPKPKTAEKQPPAPKPTKPPPPIPKPGSTVATRMGLMDAGAGARWRSDAHEEDLRRRRAECQATLDAIKARAIKAHAPAAPAAPAATHHDEEDSRRDVEHNQDDEISIEELLSLCGVGVVEML
jgi:hypothetical protein